MPKYPNAAIEVTVRLILMSRRKIELAGRSCQCNRHARGTQLGTGWIRINLLEEAVTGLGRAFALFLGSFVINACQGRARGQVGMAGHDSAQKADAEQCEVHVEKAAENMQLLIADFSQLEWFLELAMDTRSLKAIRENLQKAIHRICGSRGVVDDTLKHLDSARAAPKDELESSKADDDDISDTEYEEILEQIEPAESDEDFYVHHS
ncbi:hypothetical protein R1sor_010696 [Riccia sorocarpa]|uniref:Uncharacterized protein n=1 Tax=Riccia sorocarpa TaxID=122646 RepID=A0ABD3I2N2_9MARC